MTACNSNCIEDSAYGAPCVVHVGCAGHADGTITKGGKK